MELGQVVKPLKSSSISDQAGSMPALQKLAFTNRWDFSMRFSFVFLFALLLGTVGCSSSKDSQVIDVTEAPEPMTDEELDAEMGEP